MVLRGSEVLTVNYFSLELRHLNCFEKQENGESCFQKKVSKGGTLCLKNDTNF